jgi:hypothetical protein
MTKQLHTLSARTVATLTFAHEQTAAIVTAEFGLDKPVSPKVVTSVAHRKRDKLLAIESAAAAAQEAVAAIMAA